MPSTWLVVVTHGTDTMEETAYLLDLIHRSDKPVVRQPPFPLPDAGFDSTRVDVVNVHPGADATLARAAVAAGAQAVVLAGTGAGNGNHALLGWAREAIAAGVVVGLSTRVPEGPVVPRYGNGGGVDFVNAGAVVLDGLPLYQARLLLALLLAAGERINQEAIARFTRGWTR